MRCLPRNCDSCAEKWMIDVRRVYTSVCLTLHINTSVYRHHIYCSITRPHSHSVVFELSQTGSHFWEIDLLWNYVRNKLFDLFREPVKNDGHIKRMFKDFCDLKNIRLSHPLSDLSFCRYWGFVVQEETHPKKKKKVLENSLLIQGAQIQCYSFGEVCVSPDHSWCWWWLCVIKMY